MAHARLTRIGAARIAAAVLVAGASGCAASLPKEPPSPAIATVAASAPEPAPESFDAASVRRIASREQGLSFMLPDASGWRRDKTEPQSWVILHAATSSRLLARVWQERRAMRREDCEQQARTWRADLPVLAPDELLESRSVVLAGSYAGELAVGVSSEADVVSGRVLAVASEARSCLLIAFFTEAPAAASESARVVAERLGLMTRVIERVQRFGIDDRVRVPRL